LAAVCCSYWSNIILYGRLVRQEEMKIQPPKIIEDALSPYSKDCFRREEYAQSLYNLFKNIEDNPVVCLDAPWGSGKTTFINMWISDLKSKGIHCIYYDAYANDSSEDPFISFTSEILLFTKEHFEEEKSIVKSNIDFKKTAILVGKSFLLAGANVGIRALTAGVINKIDSELIDSVKESISDETKDAFGKLIEQKLNSVKEERETVEEFKSKLSLLGESIRAKQKFPLLIIIDELDRCKPDYALRLLERIKHLFSVNNVSFLLSMNSKPLEEHVNIVYGKIDAHEYLHKFINITTTFPKDYEQHITYNYKNYYTLLAKHYGVRNIRGMDDYSIELFIYYRLSLREIERCFSIFALFLSSNEIININNVIYIVFFLSIVKIKFPEIYNSLRHNSTSYSQAEERLSLNKKNADEHTSISWVRKVIQCYLIPEDEFISNDELISFAREIDLSIRSRNTQLQYYCDLLDRYALK
jgi:hypothetical protein